MTTAVDFDAATPGLLTPKLPAEAIFVDADFSALIPAGWTLNSCAVSISVIDGPGDAGAAAMLDGGAAVSGLVASQRVIGGVVGNDYLLTFLPNANLSSAVQSPAIQFILPVRDVRPG